MLDIVLFPLEQPKQIGDDFCGLVLNQPLGGLRVIEGNPLYEDRTEGMGAVAAYTYGEHTVVFVGTRSGQLKKCFVLISETSVFGRKLIFFGSCMELKGLNVNVVVAKALVDFKSINPLRSQRKNEADISAELAL
ncbi:Plexin A3 Precursor [Channa argus]|uniref:Plexin A3 n=1 Tax=Channa argus TaxID=215402 RepID=A0A6G1Q162_CHAAH|nr:Plexin A3 Precursor [Channa argus]